MGPVSFVGVKHAKRNTGTYPSNEVQDMAWRIASEFARCFRSALDDALAAIGKETTDYNITRIKTVSPASVPWHVAAEVAATLRLIQNIDGTHSGSPPKNEEAMDAIGNPFLPSACDEAS